MRLRRGARAFSLTLDTKKDRSVKMASKLASMIQGAFKPQTLGYSVVYGAAMTVPAFAAVYAGRACYVMTMDHDYYKDQSRQRYLDKQTIFYKEL